MSPVRPLFLQQPTFEPGCLLSHHFRLLFGDERTLLATPLFFRG